MMMTLFYYADCYRRYHKLFPGEWLFGTGKVCSPSGQYSLQLNNDGHLVFRDLVRNYIKLVENE